MVRYTRIWTRWLRRFWRRVRLAARHHLNPPPLREEADKFAHLTCSPFSQRPQVPAKQRGGVERGPRHRRELSVSLTSSTEIQMVVAGLLWPPPLNFSFSP